MSVLELGMNTTLILIGLDLRASMGANKYVHSELYGGVFCEVVCTYQPQTNCDEAHILVRGLIT